MKLHRDIFHKLLAAIVVAVTLLSGLSATAAQKWAPMRENYSLAKNVAKVGETEIMTLPLAILLNLHQTSDVEVFTILGRLVCKETLPPGSYEFSVESHGIYIVKIGDVTCKVAL